ncbi:MAG: ribosome small subunit-dependent GTPase A [Anaerolineales bacterium]|nr:ribosome small subunit-dependent GTPase A [Anaerolineales bacterium]
MKTSTIDSDDIATVPGQNVVTKQGVVYKKTLGSYDVHVDGQVIACALSSRLRKELIYPTADPNSLRRRVQEVKAIKHVDPLAVGDRVRFIQAQDGNGMIVEALPRRNQLARRTATPMPGAHAFEQVIAANVDRVVAVFAAARPAPKWNMLDRYLVSAESLELPALVCITKLDLAQEEGGAVEAELEAALQEYRRIGYRVILTSAVTGEGLAELKQALQGNVSVLVGKSGVGKTSLLNALQPGLGLRIGQVGRESGKGKHTTAHLEMFPLAFGGAVIDTPGMREFGLWGVDGDDLASCFPEMRPYIGRCKFGLDCQHDEEPGCALRQAVMAGKISPRRYQSYMRLKAGD